MGDRHMVGNDVVTNNGILRLVINLDRSPERMRSISQQLVARDLHFERLPAVDGRKLAQEELSRLEAPYDAPEKFVFRKALWPNEIACFLSHTACWKKLVKSGCEWGGDHGGRYSSVASLQVVCDVFRMDSRRSTRYSASRFTSIVCCWRKLSCSRYGIM